MYIKIISLFFFVVFLFNGTAQIVSPTKTDFNLTASCIVVDENDFLLVKKAATLLQQDIESVTGVKIPIQFNIATNKKNIVIGSLTQSSLVKSLLAKNKMIQLDLPKKWEGYEIQTIGNNLMIIGSDRRGVAYGVLELSKQMGVSPWYWWADVPIKKQLAIYINTQSSIKDAPSVKYRGIFINDEAPALSNWSKEKFGGFNHQFYEKVFELILRLKGNYLWPAMWGNAFYHDDSLNIKSADEYGIVIGTSHHEPLMRAHEEWKYFGKGKKWNYDSTETGLKEFWKVGMQRAWNEKIVSVGMRGDGDEPMSRQTATDLLERIVKDQREIIANVTGKPASETPQLWALYKEVQDYYEKGMRVPDDVTLLLCDDNWGNLRKLPKLSEKPRKGGYGIYYHFDYVGGPRNYKWINTNPLPRIWEQMHLAYEYNVRNIWIVNVGDIKPMELPISFFLDYAWNPEKIGAADIQAYAQKWSAAQFGNKFAIDIAELLSRYAKYNGRRKPELLDANTYSFNFNEWPNVVADYNALLSKAESINNELPAQYKDAYFQLVLHPIKASANLNELYLNVAQNKRAYANKWKETNLYADKVKQLYLTDSAITLAYHRINNGKWNHLMSQTHIGYTYWQQPNRQRMPSVSYLPIDSILPEKSLENFTTKKAIVPKGAKGNIFYQDEQMGVSLEANHFTKAVNNDGIAWKILPDHGRTGSAISPFPVTAKEQQPTKNSAHLEYEIYTYSSGECNISAYFSPSLNFHGATEGLQYAVSIDEETPQIISINKEDKNSISGVWNKWVGESIIIKSSKHQLSQTGKHTIKYYMVSPGVVLQKLVLDFGNIKTSYLGPPETLIKK